jgi:hypothetical protein
MKNKVSVTNNGIESSGLIKDYMEAVAEYIWNGFDARATKISIDFETNTIGTLNEIRICDNGDGMDFSLLSETFGNFNDSIKKISYQKTSSLIRGNKGKGRFSFVAFSGQAKWKTIYKKEENILSYDIIIRKNAKDIYETENNQISQTAETGTTVIFTELFEVTGNSFQSDEFRMHLAQEFGWFLLLNKEKDFSITINGEELIYENLIAESEVSLLPIKNADGIENHFKITFVRWNEKIGDKFYFYYLNSKQKEIFKELTSFNNNAIGFNHSVYVESKYFDSFSPSDLDQTKNLFEETRNTGVFKALTGHLHSMLKTKQRLFLYGEGAEKLIVSYEKTGVIPKFKNNKYDQARKKDLTDVVKGLYCLEPKIFQGLNKEQQKTSIGLINLLLDTDERENIIEIIGQIINLSNEDRAELSLLLKKTTISKISRTINLIESRFKVIELLKHLVFELTKFTNERDHIQKAIEENYWLFGEQYHIVSANEGFELLLNRYLEFIEGLEKQENKKNKKQVNSDESNRRPDIFVCRKKLILDVADNENLMEENLIVELKRPSVTIGKDQLRQIEDYLDIIRNEPNFNSQKRFWKFFIVGNKIDNYVRDQYESEKTKGKKFLVKGLLNFEIYAYTWDDIFILFDLKHKYLVENLDFDRNVLKAELIEKGINLYSNESPSIITKEIIDLSKSKELA